MGRKSKNNNKNNQPYTQASAPTHQPNTQIQTTEPNKRKKRNQPVEQAPQVQPQRQSVFARLGTKNSGTAPLPRQPVKKEVKDHPSNETRKSRRISDARKVIMTTSMTCECNKHSLDFDIMGIVLLIVTYKY